MLLKLYLHSFLLLWKIFLQQVSLVPLSAQVCHCLLIKILQPAFSLYQHLYLRVLWLLLPNQSLILRIYDHLYCSKTHKPIFNQSAPFLLVPIFDSWVNFIVLILTSMEKVETFEKFRGKSLKICQSPDVIQCIMKKFPQSPLVNRSNI